MAATTNGYAKAGEMMKMARERMRPRMSQTELGERIGLSRDQLGRLERGEVEPRIDQILAVVRETGQADLIKELLRNNDIAGLSPDGLLAGQMALPLLLNSAA